ncbi:transglycosylase SLT domain-containing protein [Nocardia camponoti]|uniref:transglycosylase SLT domain-containing protein n=1 Tax=Nocardia camponoti TaxID=1616106 RepID=UPI001E63FB94|nr:transglycosylase SLT domain-containing protein [Nocardia camponoti]
MKNLIPLALIGATLVVPAQAFADIPGVPAELQGPAQQLVAALPHDQQQQFQQAMGNPAPQFEDNLDGWIRGAMFVMSQHGIPGSYEGIYRNIMRESGGNPTAINLYDSNAAAGIPSKGLMQVIDPTFAAYHVDGTSWDIYDPVANISAACNYAANRYGTIDNVFSAY